MVPTWGEALVACPLASLTILGEPPMSAEARQLQTELQAEVPIGSEKAALEDAFRKHGWNPAFDSILNNVGALVK